MILDNEASRWLLGETLRVCGRCEAQTYFDTCPELCRDKEGQPLTLHEGHLTNVVALMRAEDREADVEGVFKELERLYPYRKPDESKIHWAPDVALAKARAKREAEARAALKKAASEGDGSHQ